MPPERTVLAFDTSGPHVAVALCDGDVVLASRVEAMAKGQAERLMPMIESVLAEGGISLSDLGAIGVGVGPGNFTGIRISVSAARGLALGLGIPAVPVTTFDLARDPETLGRVPDELASVEAPRGAAYVQMFRHGLPIGAPVLIDPAAPPAPLGRSGLAVTGHRAEEIALGLGATAVASGGGDLPGRLVRVVAWKMARGIDRTARPAPLYVRPADAAPSRDPAPVLLS